MTAALARMRSAARRAGAPPAASGVAPGVSGSAPEAVAVQAPPAVQDVGHARLLRNVAANWAGHLVFMVSGFVAPRLINDSLGDARLGIWDLGWSFASYIGLLTAGIASATNRYTGRHRARGEWAALNRITGSCLLIFSTTALLGVAVAGVTAAMLPRLLPDMGPVGIREARWLIMLLGIVAALEMPVSVPSGVITGSQRYDLLNLIESVGQGVKLAGMATVLLLQHGLIALGSVVLLGDVGISVTKYLVAKRVCPEVCYSPRLATRATLKEVIVFGGKMFLERGARIVLYQTNVLLIVYHLGPAAVALYSRSSALVQHALKLLYHYGRVYTPLVSEMQARADHDRIAKHVLDSAQLGMLLSLPMVWGLSLLGGPLLRVWMGAAFEQPLVLTILAVGHLGAMANSPMYHILLGLNRHGRVGIMTAIAAAVGIAISAGLLAFTQLGLIGAALGVALALGALNLIAVPARALRATAIPVGAYVQRVWIVPLVATAPFVGTLLWARWAFAGRPLTAVLVGCAAGAVVLASCYAWLFRRPLGRYLSDWRAARAAKKGRLVGAAT